MILLTTSTSGVVSAPAATANTNNNSNKKRPRPSRTSSILKKSSTAAVTGSCSSDSDSVSVSSSTSRHSVRANVTFQSQHLIPYLNRSDMTVEERQQSWYSKQELAGMKRELRKAVKDATEIMIVQHHHHQQQQEQEDNESTICTRGLEHFLNKAERYRRRDHTRRIVVQQQQQQHDIDDSDDEDEDDNDDDLLPLKSTFQIAQEYTIASRQSKIDAYLRAVHDAKYVQDQNDINNSIEDRGLLQGQDLEENSDHHHQKLHGQVQQRITLVDVQQSNSTCTALKQQQEPRQVPVVASVA